MITGLESAIDNVPCLGRFTIVLTAQDNAVACSDSAGAVLRCNSNKDWKAEIIAFGHTPPKLPNELFTFSAVDSEGEGWQSAANGAIVQRAEIYCRSWQSIPFFYRLLVLGNGSLTPGPYSVSGGSTPIPTSSVGRGVTVGSALPGIAEWMLALEGNLADAVWPAHKAGWPSRAPGNLDAEINFDQYPDQIDELLPLNTDAIHKLYVGDTTFWEIKWARVLELPVKYVVRNEQNKPEFTLVKTTAAFNSAVGGDPGHILRPNTDPYWGT